jgi:hypothetical protein
VNGGLEAESTRTVGERVRGDGYIARAMRSRLVIACLVGGLVVTPGLAACGSDEGTDVVEGEPVELGELSYNIQLTRFLNPADVEDSEYLVGQPTPKPGTSYLGIFLTISNNSDDEAHASADSYKVVDTLDNEYEPVSSNSPYALDVGATVPSDGQLPISDSTAQTGPNQGSLLIFAVDDFVSENRPLDLEIDSADGNGTVLLDI